MSAAIQDLRRFIEDQRAAFRRDASGRVRAIETLWERASAGPIEAAQTGELERLAHNLAGAGGTYGYPALGTAARRLETAIRDADRARIPALLAELRRQLPR